MADQVAKPADNPAAVRESIEAKPSPEGGAQSQPMDLDTPTVGNDDARAEAPGDPEPKPDTKSQAERDANTDGDADAEGEPDADPQPVQGHAPERLDNEMLNVIENLANYLTMYKDSDGYQIASQFQRIPNRRLLPDYHEVIKEPTAFSTIRTKKLKKQYATFSEFVRDLTLITHNAQVYNRPSSQVFKDAVRLREVFQEELQKLVDDGTITAEDAVLPDLGEIPEAEDSAPEELDEDDVDDDDDDDDDEDEDDDDDDSDDDGVRRRGRRSGRRSAFGRKSDMRDDDTHKRRGRPPKVFTPVEARIHSLLKGLRKMKHPNGDLLIIPFEKLPDKQTNPDYYSAISNPIALDTIKKKYKRKKYHNVDQAMRDIDLMFENAKEYNEETSQLYKDAVALQQHARQLAEQEKAKPDKEFKDEDGRRPLPEIRHKGEVWKVGDWVHITNENDLSKPIVAQIYRTWEDRDGQQWVNACWYYRPEQTVHRFEKHFFQNEVVKTGQYRDHRIDQVVDRCFVMFVTRYNKGRPRGFPKDKQVYVCEARYNEDKHKLNKIKTWASCVPDEVREKDYEMDLFDVPQKLKKMPSPIKHLLRDDAKPTDDLPKPTWGAPNAPPLIGAVHCREREANESPPPEPTPSPPPPAPIDPFRRPSMMQATRPVDGQGDIAMGNTSHFPAMPVPPTPTASHAAAAYTPHYAPRPSPTPVPVPHYGAHPPYQGGHATPQMPPQTPHYQPHQPHQPPAFNGYPSQYSAAPAPMTHQPHHPPHQMGNSLVAYDASQRLAPSPARNSIAPVPGPAAHPQVNAYNPPRPVEVYMLHEAMNSAIPEETRAQFLRDESDTVLFFTQPPLVRPHPGVSNECAGLGHSVRYLADRAREVEDRRAKRKARDELRKQDEKKRLETEEAAAEKQKEELIDRAAAIFTSWVKDMQAENEVLDASYGGWSVRDEDIDAVKP
ncbi:hypothetical protein F5X99DRAFT_382256 [Biscogniauxia marginata]|nr:hypothetical protein F5X99DRAFT_382256 [Biscogniauxia marginata]